MPEPPLSLSLLLTDVRAWAGKTLAISADEGEVAGWVARQVARLGGTVRSHVDEGRVIVAWTSDARRRPGPDEVVAWLNAGQVHEAVVVLELLLGAMPNEEGILYNLGMAHSDLGDLTRAEDLLRQCLTINPDHTNARIALGVVLLRQGRTDDAAPVLERAVADAPDNPWAHRNLAGVRQREGKLDAAVGHLRSAVALNPHDARSWAGLGQALEETGETADADEAYRRAIELAGFGEVADAAQEARSRIAQAAFRANGAGVERMDAVMYCLAALQRFTAMAPTEVQQVVAEIATVGTQGLDVNNPERTHPVRRLNDRFTGLQLVSYLYVGMQQLSPEADVGFDLSSEYAAAQSLFDGVGATEGKRSVGPRGEGDADERKGT